jgi:hypothetical protein
MRWAEYFCECEPMTCRNEDTIVRRALIALLAPQACALEHAGNNVSRRDELASTATFSPVVGSPFPTSIFIVERMSSETVSVFWSDARFGRHSEQRWREGRAQIDSFCLLTGKRIRYGDKIFRPLTPQGRPTPGCKRMILAGVVDDAIESGGQMHETRPSPDAAPRLDC